MEQPDKILSDAIEQMERQLNTCGNSTSCNLPMTTMLALAKILRDERDGRCALARLQEQRDQLIGKQHQRLEGEIAERSQRQLEITGRLAALERRMAMREVVVDDPDRGLTKFFRDANRADSTGPDKARKQAAAEIRRGMATPFEDTRIAETEERYADELTEALGYAPRSITWQRGLALVRETISQRNNARADAQVHQSALIARIHDREAQVTALQKAIDDVWALVEQPDGYGSPFWTEPGIDDTTPAQAVERVLKHLRQVVTTGVNAIMRAPAHAEAMAELNAADRQSDDDQICGC